MTTYYNNWTEKRKSVERIERSTEDASHRKCGEFGSREMARQAAAPDTFAQLKLLGQMQHFRHTKKATDPIGA